MLLENNMQNQDTACRLKWQITCTKTRARNKVSPQKPSQEQENQAMILQNKQLEPKPEGERTNCFLTGSVSCFQLSAAPSYRFGYILILVPPISGVLEWSSGSSILLLRIQCLVLTVWLTENKQAWVFVSFLACKDPHLLHFTALLCTVPDGWMHGQNRFASSYYS